MTAAVPPSDADVYAVPYRADRHARTGSLSTGLGVIIAGLATVLGLVFSGAMWWVAFQDGVDIGLVVIAFAVTVLMAATAWIAWRPVRAAARARRNLAQARDAMQISATGVGFPELDRGGWIVVPWSLITSAQVLTWRSVRFLHLGLAPDLGPDQPGVQGLDDPTVLRNLTRPALGLVGPRFALSSLERTAEEIDGALRRYSDGRTYLT